MKTLIICGVLAVLIYIAAVVIGGAIRPGYSHVANFISELISAEAPNQNFLNSMFALYNLLVGSFAVGLLIFMRTNNATPALNIGRIGGYILIAEAVFGFLTIFFPQDVRGTPATFTGTMHIILASLSSLATMGAMFCLFFWFKKTPAVTGMALYTLVSLIVVFVSGGLTAYLTGRNSPVVGLAERITIGSFLQWVLVVAVQLSRLV